MAAFSLTRRRALGAALALSATAASARAPRSTAPAQEGYLPLPGGRLWHWDSGGDGPPLLFLHPGTGGHESWYYQRDFFVKAGYRMIAYSRWGYAPSDPAPALRKTESDDLLAVMDRLQLEQATLIGVAAGAGIVAPFVAAHPDRVHRAALISSLLGIQDARIAAITERLRPPGFADLPPEFRELGPDYRTSSPDGVKRWLAIEQNRAPSSPASVRALTSLADLAASRRPLLLATGDADLFTPPALMQLAARDLPNAVYATIENSGHAPFWEQPEKFNQTLLRFCSGQPVV